jgi:hypothetical protein
VNIECLDAPLDISWQFLNILKYDFDAIDASTPMRKSEYPLNITYNLNFLTLSYVLFPTGVTPW